MAVILNVDRIFGVGHLISAQQDANWNIMMLMAVRLLKEEDFGTD